MAQNNRDFRAESLGPARELALPQGVLRYHSVGSGPTVVFVHGVLVNANLWRKVVAGLSADFRCVTLDLPFGSHLAPLPPGRRPLPARRGRPDRRRDRGARARRRHARRQRLRRRDLPARRDAAARAHRRARADLVRRVRQLPAEGAAAAASRCSRTPRCCGRCWRPRAPAPSSARSSRRRPSAPSTPRCSTPTRCRRSPTPACAATSPASSRAWTRATRSRPPSGCRRFDRPALIAWSREDRFFPQRHAERLAELLPQGRLEWIDDARTFSPEDQPARVAELVASVSAAVPAR